MKFWSWFISLFTKQISATIPPKISEPQPSPKQPEISPINTSNWTEIATNISMDFEGNEPWSNVTGNFDGMGLTCGALGWTFGYGDQQRLVLKFIEKYGHLELTRYMRKTGLEYYKAVQMTNKDGVNYVNSWSSREKVLEPYKSELKEFWQSKEMIQIQMAEIEQTISSYAHLQTDKFVADLTTLTGRDWKRSLKIFCFFFDIRVLNGSMKGVSAHDVYTLNSNLDTSVKQVIDWCKSFSAGYQIKDVRRSGEIWEEMFKAGQLNEESKILLVLGYLRANKSKYEFRGTTLVRKGIIATGIGYTEGELKKLYR